MKNTELVVFAGRSNIALARQVCRYLNIALGQSGNGRFSDREIRVELKNNVRLRDVFIIQSTCSPAENWLELLLMIDAAKRASAARITAVIPYFGYSRQDRKDESRVPISAKLMADLLEKAGANRVIAMDFHAGQIQGFFRIPVDNLYAKPILVDYIKNKFADHLSEVVVGSPDVGGVRRARSFAQKIDNLPLVIIDKRRDRPNQSEVMNVIGEVKDKIVVLVDDIIDTAGTFTQAAEALMVKGKAKEVHGVCVHPILSGEAIFKLERSSLTSLAVTDTIPLKRSAKRLHKIKVVSVAPLIAEAIKRSRSGESVRDLFI